MDNDFKKTAAAATAWDLIGKVFLAGIPNWQHCYKDEGHAFVEINNARQTWRRHRPLSRGVFRSGVFRIDRGLGGNRSDLGRTKCGREAVI